jgi:hypothetical protein
MAFRHCFGAPDCSMLLRRLSSTSLAPIKCVDLHRTLGCRIWAILDLTKFCIINKLAYDGAGKGGIEVYPQFSSLTHDDDLETSNGGTPLSCAAGKGHVSVVRLLLEHGAAVDSRNDRGRTPLDSKNDCGRTPLSYATEKGHESVVRLLLEYNALH